MAVVINELEASAAPVEGGAGGAGQPTMQPRPHETRRQLRRVALRAARIRAR